MKNLYPAALVILLLVSFTVVKTNKGRLYFPRQIADTTGLPESYTSRHFLGYDGGGSFDVASIPGNIVKYDAASATYEIMTMKAIVKGNALPAMQKPDNGVVYQGQVTSTSSFNGSYVLNGLKAENGQVIDMEIRDDAVYTLQPGRIDTATVRTAAQTIAADERRKYYYVTAATLTVLNYKFHAVDNVADKVAKKAGKMSKKVDDLGKNDTAKNGAYLKVKQPKPNVKTPALFSASDTKVLTDKTLSVQVIPIDDLLKK